MPVSPPLGFLGVAKETVKGTGVAPTAFVPVAQARVFKDELTQIPDRGMRGIMMEGDFDLVAGNVWSSWEIPASPMFADTFPWFLLNVLGDVATTGAGDPYTHTGALKNSGDGQCGSITLTDFFGFTGGSPARQYAGCQVGEVALEWNADGMLMWSAKGLGFKATNVAKPTASFSTVTPSPAWECTASIGGSGSSIIEAGKLTFKREVTAIPTADNSQAPYKIWQGGLTVEGSLTVVAEDDAEYLRYLNSTRPVVDLKWAHGSPERSLRIVMSKTAYKTAKPNHSGRWMQYEAELQALPNTTDVGASGGYSPVEVTFLNALAASTYA